MQWTVFPSGHWDGWWFQASERGLWLSGGLSGSFFPSRASGERSRVWGGTDWARWDARWSLIQTNESNVCVSDQEPS